MNETRSTFVVGGACRFKGGKTFVQKRSWEMLRIFSDHLASPVFGMQHAADDETLAYELPDSVEIVALSCRRGKGKAVSTLLGRTLSEEVRNAIDRCHAVYLRQPSWACCDVFSYARSRKKVLASYHGDWADALRQAEGSLARRTLNRAASFFVDHTMRSIARESEILFCVGRRLREKYGHFAKNCIEFANFLHTRQDIASERDVRITPPYRLLFIGGLEEYKGVKYLLQAAGHLRTQGVDFQLTIVGTGSLESSLKELSEREGLGERVRFVGYIQHGAELLETYRQADLFVLPSIASEGTPKVLMEAMSQGTPVLASDVGSIRQLLDNGEYGLLVSPKDSRCLAGEIRRALETPVLRQSLAATGLALARASTRDRQEDIVRNALKKTIPQIMGTPPYLATRQAERAISYSHVGR